MKRLAGQDFLLQILGTSFGCTLFAAHWDILIVVVSKNDGPHSRRTREEEKEAKKRARYFKDMGCKDLSLEE